MADKHSTIHSFLYLYNLFFHPYNFHISLYMLYLHKLFNHSIQVPFISLYLTSVKQVAIVFQELLNSDLHIKKGTHHYLHPLCTSS